MFHSKIDMIIEVLLVVPFTWSLNISELREHGFPNHFSFNHTYVYTPDMDNIEYTHPGIAEDFRMNSW